MITGIKKWFAAGPETVFVDESPLEWDDGEFHGNARFYLSNGVVFVIARIGRDEVRRKAVDGDKKKFPRAWAAFPHKGAL